MSRKKEISKSELHQLQDRKALELGYIDLNRLERPRNVSKVKDVATAEKWRAQINSEINNKILKLYDDTVSEYELRDINDAVNKLSREKAAWEHRIKDLGGPNYLKFSGLGKDEYVIKGYRYYGRAKELPEVKQLVERKKKRQEQHETEESEQDLFFKKGVYNLHLGNDYYGFGEEATKSEKALSNYLMKKVMNSKSSMLSGYEEDSSEKQQFLNRLSSLEEIQVSIEDTEKLLVERERKRLLNSLS